MKNVLLAFLSFLISTFRSRAILQLEILALRHQLSVYKHSKKRPKVKLADRNFLVWLSKIWSDCLDHLVFVKPDTLIRWQHKRFRDHWTRASRSGKSGRDKIAKEISELIRKMSKANPTWGSPRIMGKLKKEGIEIAKSTIEKYMVKRRKPPLQTWKTFLKNHINDLVFRGHIYLWIWIVLNPDQFRQKVRSWNSLRSVGCISLMNGWLLNPIF